MSKEAFVDEGENLFFKILRKLDDSHVLEQIVLIGSWVLPLYRKYLDDDRITVLRTSDIDFLVDRSSAIPNRYDVTQMFSLLGFDVAWSVEGLNCKFVHPAMEVEFLTPELGKGEESTVQIVRQCQGCGRVVDQVVQNRLRWS